MLNTLPVPVGQRNRKMHAFLVDPRGAVVGEPSLPDQLNAWCLANPSADVSNVDVIHLPEQTVVILYYY